MKGSIHVEDRTLCLGMPDVRGEGGLCGRGAEHRVALRQVREPGETGLHERAMGRSAYVRAAREQTARGHYREAS